MTDQEQLNPEEENKRVKVDLDSINEDLTPQSILFKEFCKYYIEKENRNPFNPGWEDKMQMLEDIVRKKLN